MQDGKRREQLLIDDVEERISVAPGGFSTIRLEGFRIEGSVEIIGNPYLARVFAKLAATL